MLKLGLLRGIRLIKSSLPSWVSTWFFTPVLKIGVSGRLVSIYVENRLPGRVLLASSIGRLARLLLELAKR